MLVLLSSSRAITTIAYRNNLCWFLTHLCVKMYDANLIRAYLRNASWSVLAISFIFSLCRSISCRPVTISTLWSDKIDMFLDLFVRFRGIAIYRLILTLFCILIHGKILSKRYRQVHKYSKYVHVHTWIPLICYHHPQPPHFSRTRKNPISNRIDMEMFLQHFSTTVLTAYLPEWIECAAVVVSFPFTCLRPKHSA